MDFTFSEDQLLLQQSVRDFLRKEVSPALIRELWASESGRSDALWAQLTGLGLVGLTVPAAHGGLGMNELDCVLPAEECGYVALPEPLLHTVLIAVPLLTSLGGELAASWLPRIAAGSARVAIGLEENQWLEDAHVADLLLLQKGAGLHALAPTEVELRPNESVDPSRKLFAVKFAATAANRVSADPALLQATMNRGALAAAAEALGLAQRMLDNTVQYTTERSQFGQPIGSFQAVKHHLADVAVRLQYARAPVYRAAWAVAQNPAAAAVAVSHARLAACAAADLAARHSIQCHGAMGYTWEADLHIFMKKAWALANTWGDSGFHKSRIAAAIFADDAALGAGTTFPG